MGCGISNLPKKYLNKNLQRTSFTKAEIRINKHRNQIRKTLYIIKEVSFSEELSLIEDKTHKKHKELNLD